MTVRHSLRVGAAQLDVGPHPDRARRDAETLLLYLLEKSKAWLMAHDDEELTPTQAASYAELLRRRALGEPIQYITGKTEFYGLPFRVTPDVLIPRPETEHLVEKSLELAAKLAPAPLRIADVGTGSGAIAVVLAHYLPYAQITAIDLSPAALAIAAENAHRNAVTLRFLEGNLLEPVARENFEIIVSNPPYVPTADRPTLSVEVRDHEPKLALFAGADGLEVYRRLIPAAFARLVPGGYLALEIGIHQSPDLAELLSAAGFQKIKFLPDLQGIPRIATAQRC